LPQLEQQASLAALLLLLVWLLESRIWMLLLLQMRWRMRMRGVVAGGVPHRWCCQLLLPSCA
jgi:hypothetical protein